MKKIMYFLKQHRNIAVIVTQVIFIILIWLLANWISHQWLPSVPSGILGLFILLLLLYIGLPVRWFGFGAYWLIANMLLFFIPALVSIIKYKQLILEDGIAILTVVVVSTLLVMSVTAMVVEQCYKWTIMNQRKKRSHKRLEGHS